MSDENKVRVVDFDMPFWSMMSFMVKWALATIPAFLILFVLGVFAVMTLGSLMGVPLAG